MKVTDIVEIVRAMDILGAERRLKEYEAMLYLSFKDPDERNCIYEDPRLPANFSDHVKGFESQAESVILGIVGSQRLIEFSFNRGLEMERDDLFQQLCRFEHLSVAQWLYNQGEVDIHDENDMAFKVACQGGRLSLAQWLHSLGGIDIHAFDDCTFRWACEEGHMSVAQRLYDLGGIDIHFEDDEALCWACGGGHLSL